MDAGQHENFHGLRIAHRFVVTTVFVVVVSLLVAVYVYHQQVSSFLQTSFEQNIDVDLQTALNYFQHVYDTPVLNDLANLNSSPTINDLLLARGNDLLLARPLAETVLTHVCRTRKSLYLSACFFDVNGVELAQVTPAHRIRASRRIDGLDLVNPVERGMAGLYAKLRQAPPGTVLVDGPFHNVAEDRFTFIAGISKVDPNLSGFGGAIFVHCDLSDYIGYLGKFRKLDRPVAWLFTPDRQPIVEHRDVSTASPYDVIRGNTEESRLIRSANCIIGQATPHIVANLFVWIPDDVYAAAIRKNIIRTVMILAFAILLSILLSLILSHQLSKPLMQLAEVSQEVSQGNYRVRASTKATGEIGLLTRSFNEMLETINTHIKNHKRHTRQLESINRELQLFRDLINQTADYVYIVDPETGNIVDANDPAARDLGYSHDELLEIRLEQIAVVPSDFSWSRFVSDLQIVDHLIRETQYQRKDGSIFGVEENIKFVQIDDASSIIAVARDLTERKSQEAEVRESHLQLRQTHEELKATQQQVIQQERLRALGHMASGIAHEFNNSLTTIIGFSELLLTDSSCLKDEELARDYLQRIRNVSDDAANVVRRMRSFYRYSHSTELESININEMIDEVIKLTRPKWRDESLAHGINVKVIPQFGKVPTIMGNGAELRELLTNLIFNAIDAIAITKEGTITITTRDDADNIEIIVADTGDGMDAATLERCLDPFFTTKTDHGTGLGLAIAYGIVKRHGGTMNADSAPNEGSTFTIQLPVYTLSREQPEKTSEPKPVEPLVILLVEDQETVCAAVTRLLEFDSHTVHVAATGSEGLEVFRRGGIDLVITDRSMPELSGDEMAERVKHDSPDTPIIMLTGFGDFMKDAGEEPEHIDLVMNKPCTLNSLRRAIAEITTRPGRTTQPTKA
tara:strand:- start:3361 stop:6102 length:2742 start_codon:yes stop_codon:yes gene_type:complete